MIASVTVVSTCSGQSGTSTGTYVCTHFGFSPSIIILLMVHIHSSVTLGLDNGSTRIAVPRAVLPQHNITKRITSRNTLNWPCPTRTGLALTVNQKRRQNPTCEAPDSIMKEGSKEGIDEGITLTLYPCIS